VEIFSFNNDAFLIHPW